LKISVGIYQAGRVHISG